MLWTLKKLLYRLAHLVMAAMFRRMDVPVPALHTGPGSVLKLPEVVRASGVARVLLVTDRGIRDLGLIDGLCEALEQAGVAYVVFDGVQPNPTIDNIEAGLQCYRDAACDGIVAFGGGSVMDCAKLIGARASNPDRSVLELRGAFKVKVDPPPLFAVATTAGTGSECTLAAVISNPAEHEKFAVAGPNLVPQHAVLDPELTKGLPPHITAHTGMDALTHAVESYIGRAGTPFTEEHAEKAVKVIFEDLEAVYRDGSDLERRGNMALASYWAGLAFTRALVGYVHAVAHNLGGMYGVPHGLANAIVLPHVLDFSRADCEEKLARLAIVGGIGEEGEAPAELAARFIAKVREMNAAMDIPTTVAELKEEDIPFLAARAMAEGNPGYPVPTLMHPTQCEALLRKLLP